MATEQIPTTLIADDAITTAKVADDAITGSLIENNPTIAGNLAVAGTSTLTGALTASGGIANAGTITAGTFQGDLSLTNGLMKAAPVFGNNDYLTMVNGSTSPSYVLGSGGAGITITLSSANSSVFMICEGEVKRGHSTTSYNFDLLVSGGGLGSGTGDISSNTTVLTQLCNGVGQDVYIPVRFAVYDKNPGSTTPTYKWIRNGTPTITYTWTKVAIIAMEILA